MKAENMSNTLKVSMIETIRELARKGWSIRRISEELGPHRNTVRKYLTADSKCTISTAGSAGGTGSKCTLPTAGRQSLCVAHDEFIQERLNLGLSARRIFQDLRLERAFEGSYESVKRYVRKLSVCEEVPFRRMEVLPGTECQVDYGTGAWVVGEDGKRRKTHLFRCTLSFSRKAYSEVNFTQETECFLRLIGRGKLSPGNFVNHPPA
jgi:transposase